MARVAACGEHGEGAAPTLFVEKGNHPGAAATQWGVTTGRSQRSQYHREESPHRNVAWPEESEMTPGQRRELWFAQAPSDGQYGGVDEANVSLDILVEELSQGR